MLERKSGRLSGRFVRQPQIECDLTGMAGFTQQMRRANLRTGARVLWAGNVPDNANRTAALSVQPSMWIHEIVREHFVRRKPLAIERSYLPVRSVSGPFLNTDGQDRSTRR